MKPGFVYAECKECKKEISASFRAEAASRECAEMEVKFAVRRHNDRCPGRPEVKVQITEERPR